MWDKNEMQWSLQDLVTCHAAWYMNVCFEIRRNLFPPWVYSKHLGCLHELQYQALYLYSINERLSKLHELKQWQKRYKSSISRYLKGRVELNAPKNQRLSDNNIIWEFLCTCNTNIHRWAKYTWNSTHTVSEYKNVDFVLSVSVRYLYYLSLNTS